MKWNCSWQYLFFLSIPAVFMMQWNSFMLWLSMKLPSGLLNMTARFLCLNVCSTLFAPLLLSDQKFRLCSPTPASSNTIAAPLYALSLMNVMKSLTLNTMFSMANCWSIAILSPMLLQLFPLPVCPCMSPMKFWFRLSSLFLMYSMKYDFFGFCTVCSACSIDFTFVI